MKSFLSGRPLHDLPAVSGDLPPKTAPVHAHAAPPAAARTTGSATGTPHVECIKQGDAIVRLVVTCACGERIEIDCLYPDAG